MYLYIQIQSGYHHNGFVATHVEFEHSVCRGSLK